jgi:hypothetical protein
MQQPEQQQMPLITEAKPTPATCARCGYQFRNPSEYRIGAGGRKLCRSIGACRKRGGAS